MGWVMREWSDEVRLGTIMADSAPAWSRVLGRPSRSPVRGRVNEGWVLREGGMVTASKSFSESSSHETLSLSVEGEEKKLSWGISAGHPKCFWISRRFDEENDDGSAGVRCLEKKERKKGCYRTTSSGPYEEERIPYRTRGKQQEKEESGSGDARRGETREIEKGTSGLGRTGGTFTVQLAGPQWWQLAEQVPAAAATGAAVAPSGARLHGAGGPRAFSTLCGFSLLSRY